MQLLPMHVQNQCTCLAPQLRSCLMVDANFITNSALPKRPPSSQLELCTPQSMLGRQTKACTTTSTRNSVGISERVWPEQKLLDNRHAK